MTRRLSLIGGSFDVSSVFFSGGLAFVNRVIHCLALPAASFCLIVLCVKRNGMPCVWNVKNRSELPLSDGIP